MRLCVGSDHAGFALKGELAQALRAAGHEVLDVGAHSAEPSDYPDFALAVGEALAAGKAERGVLICGSGVGVSVAANKLPGVRAAICHDSYSAHQGVEHDDMNVLVLGARIIGPALAHELVRAFVGARFSQDERHVRRLAKVAALEARRNRMSSPDSQTAAAANPVAALAGYRQSVWLDFIRRSLISGGELARLVREDGLGGVTSNPAIFEKAIGGSDDYKSAIEELSQHAALSPKQVFEQLAIKDIQDAADVLRPVYDRTAAADGYVSLEVAPDLARDTQGTLDEARRLWAAVGRPNAMIKVPGTAEGLPATLALLSEGINVNITLLFARETYEAVAHAYIEALEARAARGEAVDRVASVASFFVSRIDSAVDALIAEKLKSAAGEDKARLEGLRGTVAIANAKAAYQSYQRIFSGARWEALRAKGARVQRVLWASTGTKNPSYSDVLYIEELIGPDTVNTVPPETLAAFRDHGRPRASLEQDVPAAMSTLAALEAAGISLAQVTADLLADGLAKFEEPFKKLLGAVERRCQEARAARARG